MKTSARNLRTDKDKKVWMYDCAKCGVPVRLSRSQFPGKPDEYALCSPCWKEVKDNYRKGK